jgi:pyridinium-3,5-biscarboxylic acid mononucleotide synthase
VIAVPTSVGYGASFQGIAALLGMLNSCATGVTVVNIDNGLGAATAAHRLLTRIRSSPKTHVQTAEISEAHEEVVAR